MGTGVRVSPFTPAAYYEIDDLVMRAYVRDDAREMMEAITESVDRLRPWMPWIKFEPQDVHDKRKIIRDFQEEWDNRTGFTLGIFLGDKLVGSSGYHVRGPVDSLEIGYWVRTGFSGQGIARRATIALVNEAFSHREVQRVFINHDEANESSRRIPEELQFVLSSTSIREPMAPGESGTLVHWVMSRDAWSARTSS